VSKPHPDNDVLAEFHAGLITGRRGARIAGHLAGCEQCAALSGQLADLSVLLAAVPAPKMPQGVAHRLDTALAAEVARKNYPERARGDGSREDGSGERPPRRRRDFRLIALRVLAPAAAIVVLAAGGYGLSRLAGGPANQAASTSSGGARSAVPLIPSAHAQAPAEGAAPATGPRARPEFMSPHRFVVVISDVNYGRGTLRRQLISELGAPNLRLPTRAPDGRLMDCVRTVTRDVNPVYVESARFEGRPATIIVVSRNSGEVAWVVGAGCSAAKTDQLAMTTLPPGI
jgi:hypothetical protein